MQNPFLVSAVLSAIIAQILKIPINYWINRSWDWRAALKPGGMPSSHTALMIGLSTAIWNNYGSNNPYFAISTAVTLIVIYDAAGVRRQTGRHAILLNELTSSIEMLNRKLSADINIQSNPLKIVLGHSPLEVLGGIFVGIVTALLIVR